MQGKQTPKHSRKKQMNNASGGAAVAPAASSASSGLAPRSLSFTSTHAAGQDAAAYSLPPMRGSSDSGQGKSSTHQ